jgi:pimeloyl-ACP methyl ester carboxylesterase
VIARDDLPGGEERLVSKLRARGVDVTLSKAPGYGAIMQHDPHRSVVPDAAWNETTAWLSARYPAAPQARSERVSYPRSASVRENEGAPTVREEALDMGGLFGVLTEPVDDSRAGVLPAIVLHNIGANSHIGANRMYVAMSRRWAAMGFRVLRFDTAGLGDSPSNARVSENRVYSGGVTEDSRRAMDFLGRARSTRRFILVGLCSGAYVAFHAAVTDDRVAGIVLMNIQLFDWKEGDSVDVRMRDVVKSTSFYSRALVGAETWMRLLRGDVNVNVIVRGLVHKGWERTRHSLARSLRGPSTVAQAFRSMTKRGTDVLVVCGADDGGRDVIDAHLGTNALLMQHDPHFRFEILEGTDHTFSPRWAQEKLLSLLTRHLESHFAEDRVPPAPLVTSIHDVK